MKILKLTRQYLDNCSLGTTTYKGEFIFNTVELPYLSNEPFKSCIPPGVYNIHFHNTDKYPNTFVLKNHNLGIGINKGESLRYGCCIHAANFPYEVEGCIGPGLNLHPTIYGVANSRLAMGVLKDIIGFGHPDEYTGYQLEIKWLKIKNTQ